MPRKFDFICVNGVFNVSAVFTNFFLPSFNFDVEMIRRDFSFNLILEDDRRATFKYWPFKDSSKCNKAKMAEAGFYCTGKKSDGDLAICYICNKELDGWEEDDDPWSEHKKHASYCPFIKLGKKPSMFTVNDVLQLQKEHEVFVLNRIWEEKEKQFVANVEEMIEIMERAEVKENDKPRAHYGSKRASRKRSSRK